MQTGARSIVGKQHYPSSLVFIVGKDCPDDEGVVDIVHPICAVMVMIISLFLKLV